MQHKHICEFHAITIFFILITIYHGVNNIFVNLF